MLAELLWLLLLAHGSRVDLLLLWGIDAGLLLLLSLVVVVVLGLWMVAVVVGLNVMHLRRLVSFMVAVVLLLLHVVLVQFLVAAVALRARELVLMAHWRGVTGALVSVCCGGQHGGARGGHLLLCSLLVLMVMVAVGNHHFKLISIELNQQILLALLSIIDQVKFSLASYDTFTQQIDHH